MLNMQVGQYMVAIQELGGNLMEKKNDAVEAALDHLMQDYVKKLKEIKSVEDDVQALTLMEEAGSSFMTRTLHLQPQLKAYYQSLSRQEASLKAQKLLIKPYFRQINDLALDVDYQQRINKNPHLKKAYEQLDAFLYILYITHQAHTGTNTLAKS